MLTTIWLEFRDILGNLIQRINVDDLDTGPNSIPEGAVTYRMYLTINPNNFHTANAVGKRG